EGQLKIVETLQLTDLEVVNNDSGFLKASEESKVPAFVYRGSYLELNYTNASTCSTYYEISGNELRGNILCSALVSNLNEKTFISMEFQCMNQDYLLFEIKEEML
ncbi:MAG: hypothetical protein AAF203_10100, partial [Pseudomonadota bacterium]